MLTIFEIAHRASNALKLCCHLDDLRQIWADRNPNWLSSSANPIRHAVAE
jgi:hypothetical protein